LDRGLDVAAPTWVAGPIEGDVLVQTSAHGTPQRATVRLSGGGLRVDWHEPQRRVAPGQSVVLYDLDDRCVHGGGIAA
jgi:tRNA-specific 2-thiouridylase